MYLKEVNLSQAMKVRTSLTIHRDLDHVNTLNSSIRALLAGPKPGTSKQST